MVADVVEVGDDGKKVGGDTKIKGEANIGV